MLKLSDNILDHETSGNTPVYVCNKPRLVIKACRCTMHPELIGTSPLNLLMAWSEPNIYNHFSIHSFLKTNIIPGIFIMSNLSMEARIELETRDLKPNEVSKWI